MKILALEFSSERRSVAISEEGQVRGRAQETGAREGRALGLVESALREARLEREQLDCLAVGLGPGSYTGIRSAIALAQGWQLARGIKILGISSVECLAAQAQCERIFGRANIVIDAQRDELYLAGYEIGATDRREAEPLHLARSEEARARAEAGQLIIGPGVAKGFSAGRLLFPDAAMLCRLAAGRNDFVRAEELEPIYLRPTSFVKAPPPRILPAV
jgi:tRNA threonylcarbamoyl adenosine modification protein YeaZ